MNLVHDLIFFNYLIFFVIQDHDSCGGDSGGPLIVRKSKTSPMYLLGVVSFGTRDCGTGSPGVYTRVESYISWIRSKLRP